LNRFDEILESFVSRYGLKTGPQARPFGISQLLEGSDGANEDTLRELGLGPEGDRELVESILDFSRLLLEKCGNRSLYNSSDRLNELLNTTSLSLLHGTLRVALCLAQRYRDRLRSGHFQHPPLTTHYNFDMDRIEKLAQQIPNPHADSKKLLPTSPVKTAKGKEKTPRLTQRRTSNAVDPNDFRSLCGTSADVDKTEKEDGDLESDHGDWEAWAQVTVMLSTSDNQIGNVQAARESPSQHDQNLPSSPTPIRRQSSTGRSRLSRLSTSEDVNGHSESTENQDQRARPPPDRFSPSISTILSSPLEVVLASGLTSVPAAMHYELLHKLRTAYGLIRSSAARRQLLAIRLLAIANLAYVLPDNQFQQKMYSQDREPGQPQQLVQQLVSLLYAGSGSDNQVPLFVQSHALDALCALTKQKSITSDLTSRLSITANHGTLLYLVQKGLADIAKDGDATDNVVGDEWRDSLFSLLKLTLDASPHTTRNSDAFASPALMTAYREVLQTHTEKAQRLYVKVLEFLESFTHHIKDGLATLLNNGTFEAVTDLLNYLVSSALQLVQDKRDFPSDYRTPSIDYQIPYLHQQSIRAILTFINGVNGHQGGPADRVLRSLIDSNKLLDAFRLVVQHASTFGAHTWSEVVKAMNSFLHNEPTSYTVISEAGLSKSFLESITMKKTEVSSRTNGVQSESSHQTATATELASTDSVQKSEADVDLPGSTPEVVTSNPEHGPIGILPAAEAISNASQTFGAICLTTAGFEVFKSSGALEAFFDVFVSAPHVKAMNEPNLLAVLGSTFDELVRHHPGMRSDILSMILVTLSRVKTLCRFMARDVGAGAKLWIGDGGNGLTVAGGNQALLQEILPQTAAGAIQATSVPSRLQLPNGKILASYIPINADTISETLIPEEKDGNDLTVADYMTPIVGFLMSFFENQTLCSSFIDAGGVELVLDLATMPSLPFDFLRPSANIGTSHDVAQVIHMMAETKPHLVLPSLLNRALSACQQLEHFAQNQPPDMSCYFGALTRQPGEASELMETDTNDWIRQNGTKLAKALTSTHVLTTILTETFESPIYSSRNPQPAVFTQVNLADLYAQLCARLGKISAACIREDIALQKNAPKSWLEATRPKDFVTGNDDLDQILGLDRNQDPQAEPAEEPAEVPSDNAPQSGLSINAEAPSQSSAEDRRLAVDKKTATFKNVVVLRYLLTQLPPAITQFFGLLGRGLLTKRRLELYQKQNALMVAEAIARGLVSQLEPEFLRSSKPFESRNQFLETRFAYLVVVLVNLYHVTFDMSPSADFKQSVTSVVLSFRNIGGLRLLKNIGKEFFDELKSCQFSNDKSPSIATANSGLKVILDILEHLTSAKCVVESAQSSLLKNQDRSKPPYFVPDQFLLELRMEAFPLSRMIWVSDYADQASQESQAVIEKLVAILRHVLSGEKEDEAHKEGHDVSFRSIESSRKTQPVPNPRDLEMLIGQGFDEALVREALYRCNNHAAHAEEYCKSYARDLTRQRNPIPDYELDPKSASDRKALQHGDQAEPTLSDQAMPTSPTNSELPAGTALSHAMSIDSLLNENENPESEAQQIMTNETDGHRGTTTPSELPRFTVASIESERKLLRQDLTERCLNILNNHHDVTFELSELILSATRKLHDEANDFRENASELVINSLISLQTDDISQLEGSKVAAYSHLTALLLQDKDMYEACLGELQETFHNLLGFIKIPQASAIQESSPWVGHVLLIFEKMLSDDAEPRKINWSPPVSIDAPLIAPSTPEKVEVVTQELKKELFDAVLSVLPQIGKDKSLALSVARVLVILTRKREIAVLLGEKRNIQRLFVMIKQLANAVDDRLQSALLLILRHVIEDDDTLRQIMRSEIVANFDNPRNSRQTDTNTYVRQMSHLVLRSPEIFIEVTNEKLKLQRSESHRVPQSLILKPEAESNEEVENGHAATGSTESPQSTIPTTEANAESDKIDPNQDNKSRPADVKPPVVEHPDGIIHFLLSELLSYKDIEDKESADGPNEPAGLDPLDVENTIDSANGNISDAASDLGTTPARPPGSQFRQPFKGEDHPIYIYRCFLLQCLTELLYSYNRTKIEFINFSRKADPLAMTPSKPRSGILNYLLNGLIPTGSLEPDDSSASFRKRTITSEWAMKVVVALCSKTGESGLIPTSQRYSTYQRVADNDDDPDLAFVRRFVLEHALRAFKDANNSSENLPVKYSRLLCLADLFHKLISKPSGPEGASASNNNSHKTLSKLMFEKNFIAVLTSSLAEIDLTFPGSKRVVKHILKPLNELTETAYNLSVTSPSSITSALGTSDEDVISSASSVSDVEDEREETPDLFRNSALAMLEPNRQDDSSSESGEEDDGDDEMYDGDYAEDMEYEDGMPTVDPNDGEVVSDEDIDEELHGAGPMEGLPGDTPMDIEVVMDDSHMDMDTDEDDGAEEEEDEEDEDEEVEEDEDEEDEDGEDFIAGADDAILEGEINGDNENDSLADGEDGEGEWHSEEDEENDMDDADAERVEEILDGADAVAPAIEGDDSGHDQLNNLLQILGEAPDDGGDGTARPPAGLLIQAGIDDDMPGNDDGDDEEGDDLDENDEDVTYQTFNDMLNSDMLNDPDTSWPWDEPPSILRGQGGHHRHVRTVPGQMPNFITRQIASHGMPMLPTIARSHRHAVPARSTDDGTNPLLQRPGARPTISNAIPTPSDFAHGFNPGFTALFPPGSGHGGVIDAIMEAVSRGDGRFDVTNHRHGPIDIRINASPQQFREFLRPPHPSSFPRSSREDPYRAVSFTPSLTVTRWQEEARLLYGNSYDQKSLHIVPALLSVLFPPAIEEAKARIIKAEEDRKREEVERAERERQDRLEREEAERKQKEEEAREAAAKAEAEAIAAAEAAAEARQVAQSQDQPTQSTDDTEPMQDVQATGPGEVTIPQTEDASADGAGEAGPSQPTARVYTTIRGRQLDITDLDIDAEFLEGLPEEIREEVIMTQYAERRHRAAEQGEPSNEISAEFLEALPEDIREELLQQDAQDRRRREREAARRRAAEAGGPARAEEMDADSFMATLDPALRRAILAEQSDDVLQHLAPHFAAEARAMFNLHSYGRLPVGREAREDRDAQEPSSGKEPRKQVVQMVDKAGVATLMRLMFMPLQGSARQNLYRVLQNVCGHRQTRNEVITSLLCILKHGSADTSAVERSLADLSLRAKTSVNQKTPQPLKQTLSLPSNIAGGDEITPLMVVQQCLGALSSLTQYNVSVASFFVREFEGSSLMKSKSSRKGKTKETRASKFALNDLISLLDRKLITENSSCMEPLAALLATVTQPLTWQIKRDKPVEPPKTQAAETSAAEALPESAAALPTSNIEVAEVEPASPEVPSLETAAANVDGSSVPNGNAESTSTLEATNEGATAGHEEAKGKKLPDPPEIPDSNLRLVVGILSARECNSKTFRDAVTTITNLSLITNAREVFGKELVSQAQILSQSILADLEELLPSIRDAKSGTDIQNIATSRFSPASSDQAKLLRVLTALDYIFDPKRPENNGKVETEGSNPSEILVSLYESPTFLPLWSKLSECLSAMRERDSTASAATVLLPLIESLMLVCKNTSLKDAPMARHVREQSVTTPTMEMPNSLETLFFNFTTEHRKILNELVRQNSKLMSGSFSLLVKNPKVLEFDNKRSYFNRQVHARRETRHPQPPLQLSVRRDHVFLDSFKSLYFKSADEMKYGKLSIRFHGEEGVDAGGVTREWFQVLARGMFNPNYALFTPVASDKTTFHPSRLSGVNQEHLMYFKFIGRIIGKALYEGRVLDCHFSRAVYKQILGKTISIKDMESLDLDYYKSLLWILENDITDVLTETFSLRSEDFGEDRIIDLIENGRNIPVTEANKQEYVQLVAEYRLTGSVKDQLENFLKGFNDIIPAELISIFNEQELELLISGLPDIDVDDWKANTEYHNYTPSSPQIQWFWRLVISGLVPILCGANCLSSAVAGFSGEERAKLLQFVTGTSKTPLNGFADLEGMNGITRFNIHKDYGNKDRLPSSHTCFNRTSYALHVNERRLIL
jgi:E3 ubiquitin-protein ligase HUWE1